MGEIRTHGRTAKVLEALRKHKNVEVSVHDLCEETDLDMRQVSGAISNLKRTWKIETPTRGWYVFKGPLSGKADQGTVSVSAKAKVVSILQDDRLLVEVDGYLYVATPIEI